MSLPVSPTQQNPTYHASLTDGVSTLGFVLSNSSGQPDSRAFRRFPIKATALKTFQGDSKYSDAEPPYFTIAQDDWSGGRGSLRFEDNKTMYHDGEGVDTMNSGAVILGPQVRWATGYHLQAGGTYFANQLLPATDFYWRSLYGADRYHAVQFTANVGYTQENIQLWLRKIGSPGTLTVSLYSDITGSPGNAIVATTTLSNAPTDKDSKWSKASLSIALSNGGIYWIVVHSAAADTVTNHYDVGETLTAGGMKNDGEIGSQWVAANAIFYRLTGVQNSFNARFYEYKGQLYIAADYLMGGNRIFMNGWRGVCDDNTGTLPKLNDATQTGWASGFDGKVARITAGPLSGIDQDWREITAAINGQLSVAPPWDIVNTTADEYVVLGSEKFYAISRATNFGQYKLSSVSVANGIVYFGCGNLYGMWKHREYNRDGTWMADTSTNCWWPIASYGQFSKVINDPISGPVLWFGLNPGRGGESRPYVFKTLTPRGWSTSSLSNVVIYTLITDMDEQSVSNVTRTFVPYQVNFTVYSGIITTVNQTPTAGGTGYTVGDQLTLVEFPAGKPPGYNIQGSGETAKVQVATIGGSGEVLTVTLVGGQEGFDYSVGAAKATTGGTGTGCTIEVTGITGFGTGILGSKAITSMDLRFTDRILLSMLSSRDMDAGDIEILLDDSANCASPVLQLAMPSMRGGGITQPILQYDISNSDGSEQIISVGIQLTRDLPTFLLVISGEITAWDVFEPIFVGDEGDNITGLEIYGEPETLWVFTESGMGEIRNNIYLPTPLRELRSVRNPNNGVASTVNDVYLYFSFRDGLEKYYRQNLEDIGPNRGDGLGEKRGWIKHLVTYPTMVIAGVSSFGRNAPLEATILAYSGRSWHELYTLGGVFGLYIQSIPTRSDRLWFCNGHDIGWLQLEFATNNLPSTTDYRFKHEGWFETAWIYTNQPEIPKAFKSITITAENLSALRSIDVLYKVDSDTTWTEVGTATTSPTTEINFAATAITGKRIKLKFRVHTNDATQTPKMVAWALKGYGVEPLKYGYTWLTKLSEGDLSIDLEGDDTSTWGYAARVETALAVLDGWAAAVTPLTLNAVFSPMDNKTVVCRAVPTQSLRVLPDEQIEEHILQVTVEQL